MSDSQNGDPADDLQINSVDRFRKRSTRLHLEEHSHCEVPAGCGGVVLRWRDPAGGVPIVLEVFSLHTLTMAINGEQTSAGHRTLSHGEHTFVFEIERTTDHRARFLMVAARHGGPNRVEDRTIPQLCSDTDGTWMWTDTEGGDLQLVTGLNLDAADIAEDNRRWRFERLQRMGAQPLALPPGDGPVWIHKKVVVGRDMDPEPEP